MTLPDQMTDRWALRADPSPGQRTLYWHVLMREYPQVGELASQARHRLAPFTGLHMTPPEWLHMTTHVAGPADQFTDQQMQRMTEAASGYLADVPPITVSLGKALYHPEAIMLAVTPIGDLTPIRAAALTATNDVVSPADEEPGWAPHITLCYSNSPAARPAGYYGPGQATARMSDRHRRREPRHPGRPRTRLELDHCRHHPPARHRSGVAPAQPRNVIVDGSCSDDP
jgi:2'-5' RNA ligase